MKMEKSKSKIFLIVVGILMLVIGCNFFVSFVGMFIIGLIEVIKYFASNGGNARINFEIIFEQVINQVMNSAYIMTIVYMVLAFVIIVLIYKIGKKSLTSFIPLNKIAVLKVILCIPLSIGLAIFLNGIIGLLSRVFTLPGYESALQITSFNSESYIIQIIAIVIIAPLFEEFVFRGIIFTELKKGFAIKNAIIIQAIFFGIYHLNITQGIYAFVLGCVMGMVVYWTNSIWASITMHFSINLLGTIGGLLEQSSDVSGNIINDIITIIIALIIFIVFSILLNKISSKSKNSLEVIKENI